LPSFVNLILGLKHQIKSYLCSLNQRLHFMLKSITLMLAFFVLMGCNTGQKSTTVHSQNVQNTQNINMDTISYSMGVLIAQNLKQQGMENLNLDDFSKAIKDVMSDGKLKISIEDANINIQQYMQGQQEKMHAAVIKAGEEFLATNTKREGVVTLDSGLQYEIMKAGDGVKPTATDNVTTHYHGTLLDGTVFDSSVTRGQPASFPVNGVIQGWQEALQLMPLGSKWRLFVPHQLAYGERGAGSTIMPYSTLIFEVELLKIN